MHDHYAEKLIQCLDDIFIQLGEINASLSKISRNTSDPHLNYRDIEKELSYIGARLDEIVTK